MEMEMEINKSGLFNTIKKWFECTEFEVGFQKKRKEWKCKLDPKMELRMEWQSTFYISLYNSNEYCFELN